MDCDYKDKIVSYIDNELNDLDRKNFEYELQNNSELNEEYLEIKNLLNSLSKLPEVKSSSNFIVSLNNKIDAYESKKENGLQTFLNNILGNNYLPRISVVAMSLIFVFSLMYFSNLESYNSSSLILSNSSSTNDTSISNEVADIDSLEISSDIDK